jgi:hypothetical protein
LREANGGSCGYLTVGSEQNVGPIAYGFSNAANQILCPTQLS